MKKSLFFLCFVFIGTIFVYSEQKNIAVNPSFEDVSGDLPVGYKASAWKQDKSCEIVVDKTIFRAGNNSLKITNLEDNDARVSQTIKVSPNKYYNISGWVKTDGIGEKGKGANISISNLFCSSQDLKGTVKTWTKIELNGKTGPDQTELTYTMGIGGFGSINSGKAWFDEISITEFNEAQKGIEYAPLYNEVKKDDKDKNAKGTNGSPASVNYTLLIIGAILLLASILIVAIIIRAKKKK